MFSKTILCGTQWTIYHCNNMRNIFNLRLKYYKLYEIKSKGNLALCPVII